MLEHVLPSASLYVGQFAEEPPGNLDPLNPFVVERKADVELASRASSCSRQPRGGLGGLGRSRGSAWPAELRETVPRGFKLPFQLGNPRLLYGDSCLVIANGAHSADSAAVIGANQVFRSTRRATELPI